MLLLLMRLRLTAAACGVDHDHKTVTKTDFVRYSQSMPNIAIAVVEMITNEHMHRNL